MMPLQECIKNKKSGYRWGESGFCYTYHKGNESSRKRAKQKALKQGMAIEGLENFQKIRKKK